MLLNRRRRFTTDESGIALVEFLLVFPVLMMMILGVVQFGVMFITWSAMNNAARDTARQWAVGEISSEAEAEADVVSGLAFISWVDAADWNADATAKSGSQLTVSVTATTASIIPLLPLNSSLRATVVIREE